MIITATNNPSFSAYILYVTSIAAFVGNELAVYPIQKQKEGKISLLILYFYHFIILFIFIFDNQRYVKWAANKWNLVIYSAVRFLLLPFLLIYAQLFKWHNDIFVSTPVLFLFFLILQFFSILFYLLFSFVMFL